MDLKPAAQRGSDDPPYFDLKRHIAPTRTCQERRYHCILMRSTKAHLHSVTCVISIPMEEENHFCDANSVFRAQVSSDRGSFADSNLALCDPQIGGGEEEVCALECVCLDGLSEIYIFPLGERTAGCDSRNVITDDRGAAFK